MALCIFNKYLHKTHPDEKIFNTDPFYGFIQRMKYIFMAGAPGSKWSSVSKNIYFSASIDRSDASPEREYYHDAPGTLQLMHMGAYFDPGMEFGLPEQLDLYDRATLELIFDSAFDPDAQGVRIIKSHIFCHYIDFLKRTWPDCPVVLVDRPDDSCLGWWVKCGHFNITYPLYHEYYQDLKHMAQHIQAQNSDLRTAWNKYDGTEPANNETLAHDLGIELPPIEYFQDYKQADIRIKVI